MTVQVSWYDDTKTILYYLYGRQWTWEDLKLAMDRTQTLACEVDHAFDQIVDLSGAPLVPRGNMLTHIRSIRGKQPVNVRATAVVGRSMILGVIQRLLDASGAGKRARPFAIHQTLEEALAWLRTLPEAGQDRAEAALPDTESSDFRHSS